MEFNFAKISLQQKQQGFGVLFDPRGKEQGETAMTALGGYNTKSKKISRDSATCSFSVFLLVLIPFLYSHVFKCHLPSYMLVRNFPVKERKIAKPVQEILHYLGLNQ